MSERINSDERLKAIDREQNIPAAFQRALNRWERKTDKSLGMEKMTVAEMESVRDEVRVGRRWLKDLERAIELKLPGAAVYCDAVLQNLLFNLVKYSDLYPAHNRNIPHAERGLKIIRAAAAGHESIHGTKAEKKIKWERYQLLVDGIRRKTPTTSYMEACRKTAKHFNVSLKTVQRHTNK